MRSLAIILFCVLSLTDSAVAQSPRALLKQLRQIKLLETTRYDVQQILYQYKATDPDAHRQEFSSDDVSIEVFYSSGQCVDDPDEDDATEIWQVDEWRVTRIEVEPSEAITAKDLGVDLSKFTKEQRYRDVEDVHVYHDKRLGLFFLTRDGEIEEVNLFPPSSMASGLCADNTIVKEFYSRKSWFNIKLEERSPETYCPVANVQDLELSVSEIAGATSDKTISVTTTAHDPENDVLTYAYIVSAGQIKGTGPKVIWDLTSVPAGTYTITAAVDDGCGLCGKTMTKSVVVK